MIMPNKSIKNSHALYVNSFLCGMSRPSKSIHIKNILQVDKTLKNTLSNFLLLLLLVLFLETGSCYIVLDGREHRD